MTPLRQGVSLVNRLRGGLSLLLAALNTLFWTLPILFLQFLKLLAPSHSWRRVCGILQDAVGTWWISFNNLGLRILNPVRWTVEMPPSLPPDRWYVVVANHQSWVDILVLQKVLNGQVPFLKFFLKKELFWVPFLGLAWWSLDYPFLERSRSPGRDLEAIRRAGERFKLAPVSIMIFAEGTRFSREKHEQQGSPYRHLLKPKAAGMAAILDHMGETVQRILDVTIAYPSGTPSMWEFLCGEVEEIRVHVREIPVTEDLRGDFGQDKGFRRSFTVWMRAFWEEKDGLLGELLGRP